MQCQQASSHLEVAEIHTTLRKEEQEDELQSSRHSAQAHHPSPAASYMRESSADCIGDNLSQSDHDDANKDIQQMDNGLGMEERT